MKKNFKNSRFFLRDLKQQVFTGAFIICFVVCLTFPAVARNMAGVEVSEMFKASDGKQLHLNGAGIRSKFFFKIYVGELYLENPSRDVEAVINDNGTKRIVMHFLHDEVSKEKLVAGWNEGFEKNSTTEQLAVLQPRINQFNKMFTTVHAGDVIILNYQSGQGTEVTIRGERKGVITGKDFNDALLRIWLGKKPVTEDLKEALLDYSKKK